MNVDRSVSWLRPAFFLIASVLVAGGAVGCASPSSDEDLAANEGAASTDELAKLDAVASAELKAGSTSTVIGAPKKIAALVDAFKEMAPTTALPRCAPTADTPKIVLKDAKGRMVLETSNCTTESFYVKLASGWRTIAVAKAEVPFKAKPALGDVLWGITGTFSQDGDRLVETGVDPNTEMTSAVPRCMVPADAPVLTYKRGEETAATATLLVDCAGNDLTKVPANLKWGSNGSTWIVLDFAKATGIGAGFLQGEN